MMWRLETILQQLEVAGSSAGTLIEKAQTSGYNPMGLDVVLPGQATMEVHFRKYHGLGNDYLVVDPNVQDVELTPEVIRLICDRNFGIGSDGILYGPFESDDGPAVRIFNPDGSEAEKSGNGIRIFSRYLVEAGYVKESVFTLQTLGGPVEVRMPQQDLADLVGTTRESVNKQLRAWAQEGIVELGRSRVVLKKPKALERVAESFDV